MTPVPPPVPAPSRPVHAGIRLPVGFVGLSVILAIISLLTNILSFIPQPIGAAIVIAAALASYVFFVHLLERRAVSELEVRRWPEAPVGLLLGGALFSATIGLLALLGCYRVDGTGGWQGVVEMASLSLVSGVGEELILRGIVFRITEELTGTWISLAISAVLFGLMHLGNKNATLFGALAIALEAGILLAAAYLLTRRLWLAFGLHAGWNFVQGGIFSVAVSGHEAKGLLHGALTGPDWLSGGSFGAEASPVAVAVCLAAAIPMLVLARRRGQWRPAPWRKAQPAPVALPGAPG